MTDQQSNQLFFFVWESKEHWKIKSVSPNVTQLTGYSPEDFSEGRVNYRDLIHPEDLPRVEREVKERILSGRDGWVHQDYRIITKEGLVKWVLDITTCVFCEEKKTSVYYSYLIDTTDRHEREEIFNTLVELSPVGMFLRQGDKLVYVNRALERITGYTKEELISLPVLELIHPKDKEKVKTVMALRDVGEKTPITYEVRLRKKGGKYIYVRISSSAALYRGKPAGVGVVIDITSMKKTEERLRYLSTHDYLTELYNRRAMEEFLQKELERSKRYGTPFSIILVDVDDFKKINDTLGHQVGDAVLKDLSKLILRNLRKSDVIGRWGGEEFLVILPMVKDPIPIAEKLRSKVQESFRGMVSISAGSTSYKEGDSMDTMLLRADKALYLAKSKGKNRVEYLE
ncbi:sensor domain-containing diguanylate cyclase [Thermocrinis minervae]|uniref:PAS domain S-box-containing protein/diguanylate cyclase (GGDEF) domain-containing protein n=1 Tax=Thermocrinis minervae TaxID=381751 RepID=A0A1M6RL84_9AQUI|nr:GGDEF domain-containing protein [Thermocrinis minervae]SHK33180.1 PAS domain S-box-containing protein/diguanylate cyclase (GGDEF) domain-containing protein [Thermocrinis minervae]